MSDDDYGLTKIAPTDPMRPPELDYKPHNPAKYRPSIGLIGCGGITSGHLKAYKEAGYRVVAMCDIDAEKAEKRREEFFPDAATFTDYKELLTRSDIEVVDVATHPLERVEILEAALKAKKHVLSQKPFVLDLDVGERLVRLADENGVKLAVNQNGRWAPHFSYIRQAIKSGLLGDITCAHLGVHWDHTWIKGSPFEDIHYIILYDFGIHWFDMIAQIFEGQTPRRIFGSTSRAAGQTLRPPMLSQVAFEFDNAQASLSFDATVVYGQLDETFVAGTDGTITSAGPSLSDQTVTLYTAKGYGSPPLEGAWFPQGFHGTMGELLCAIEEDREPGNSGRNNLKSLELCFAAIASAADGLPKTPGEVRQLPSLTAPV